MLCTGVSFDKHRPETDETMSAQRDGTKCCFAVTQSKVRSGMGFPIFEAAAALMRDVSTARTLEWVETECAVRSLRRSARLRYRDFEGAQARRKGRRFDTQ